MRFKSAAALILFAVLTTSADLSAQEVVPEEGQASSEKATANGTTKSSAKTQIINDYEDFKKAVARYSANMARYQSGVKKAVMSEYQERLSSTDSQYNEQITKLREEEGELRDQAIARMEAFIERYGDKHEKSAEVLYRLAKLHYEKSDDEFIASQDLPDADPNAVPDFSKTLYYTGKLRQNFKDFEQMDGAYYLEGFCLLQMERNEESKDRFLALANEFPKSTKVAEAYTRVGEYHFMKSQDAIQGLGGEVQWSDALKYYSKAVDEGPETSIYDRALYRKAWTEYYTEDYDSMIKDFIALVHHADTLPQGSALRSEAIEFMAAALAEEDWDLTDDISRDPDFGMKRFDKYLNQGHPYEVEVLRAYANTLLEQSRFDYAAEAYEAYLERNKCSKDAPEIIQVYIATLNMSGQSDKAADIQAHLDQRFGEKSEWYSCQIQDGNLESIASADGLIVRSLKDSIATFYGRMTQAADLVAETEAELEKGGLSATDRYALEVKRDQAKADVDTNYREIIRLTEELLKRFPNDTDAYTHRYMLADSYFNTRQFDKAAAEFEKVRDAGEGRYRRSAAYGAIEARKELAIADARTGTKSGLGLEPNEIQELVVNGTLALNLAPSYVLDQIKADNSMSEDAVNEVIASREGQIIQHELTSQTQELLSARDKYNELNLDSEKKEGEQNLTPTFRYLNALVYYNHGLYDEAEKRFNVVINENPSSNDAILSAQWIIMMYKARGDLDKVAEMSDYYASLHLGSGEAADDLNTRLTGIKYVALFDKAQKLFKDGKYKESAEEFERIVDENPKFERIHLALYNAGVAYERIKYYDSAVRLYRRLYTEYNKTDEAVDALYRVGWNAEKFFDFDTAIESYMELYNNKSAQYQRYAQRPDALRRTAEIQSTIQDYKLAAKNYELYHKNHGNLNDAPVMLYKAGLAYEKLHNYDQMARVFDTFRKNYESDVTYRVNILESYIKQADALYEDDRLKKAAPFYEEARDVYQRAPAAAGKGGAYFAAKAQFMLGEIAYNDWLKKPLKGKLKVVKENLTTRMDGMRNLFDIYTTVLSYKSPEWTMAAKYAIARTYHQITDELENAECPTDLDEDTCIGMQGEFMNLAQAMRAKGVEIYSDVLEFSRTENYSNKWSNLSSRGLGLLSPQEFTLDQLSEWRAVYSPEPFIDANTLIEMRKAEQNEQPESTETKESINP